MRFPFDELTRLLVLAQANGGAGDGAGAPAAGDGGGEGAAPSGGIFGDPILMVLIMAAMAMFYLMVARPQRKKQKEAQEMLSNLKENDQVVTIGGIVGSIVSFSKDGAEVVIRTDEKSNTKLRVLRSHISRPLAVPDETEGEPKDLSKSAS
jgi:preprotein translocase subunit YajC